MSKVRIESKIVPAKLNTKYIPTSTKNTDMDQRSTLEAIILNLATVLNVETISTVMSARGNIFYCTTPNENHGYQSATNTILDLSILLKNQ